MPSGLNCAELTLSLCPSNVCTHSPVATLHTRTVLSSLADTIFVPSGLNCAEITSPLCPSNVCTHSPVATLHTRTVLSSLADTIFVPSGLNCAELTPTAVPLQCLHTLPCRHAPHAHSLVLTRRYDIRAIRAKLRRTHPPLCPSNVCTHSPVATLHTRMPSGLNCAESPHRCAPPMSAVHAPHVPTRRYDIRAIRAKLRRIHPIAVPLQCLHTLPCRHAPHAQTKDPLYFQYIINYLENENKIQTLDTITGLGNLNTI